MSISLKYNLFENEIENLKGNYESLIESDKNYLSNNDQKLLNEYFEIMKDNRNTSKQILLNVLNDNQFSNEIKEFFITNLPFIVNEKNELLENNTIKLNIKVEDELDAKTITNDYNRLVENELFDKRNKTYYDNVKAYKSWFNENLRNGDKNVLIAGLNEHWVKVMDWDESDEKKITEEKIEDIKNRINTYFNEKYINIEKATGIKITYQSETTAENIENPEISEKEIPTVDIDINNFKSINIEDKTTKEQKGIDKDKFIKYLYENNIIANRNSKYDFENQNIIAHLYFPYIDGDFFITNFEIKNGDFLLYGYCHYGDDILAQPEYISLNSLYNYAETVEKINKGTYYEIHKKPIPLQLETNQFVFGQRVKDYVKSNNKTYGMEKMVMNIDFNDNINKFKIIEQNNNLSSLDNKENRSENEVKEKRTMKKFDLSYNLFDSEIDMFFKRLATDKNGYEGIEGNDGWLKDNESINIIEGQLNQMKENRNLSKKIILDVLNDKDEKFPMNVKLFYITNVEDIINEKNEFLYDRKGFLNYSTIIKDLLIDYINKNNFIYQDNSKDIMNSILRNNKVEDFAERLSKDIPMVDFLNSNEAFGKVVQDYINNNTKLCIELYGTEKQGTQYDIDEINKGFDKLVKDVETKVHNQEDFEKLSEFANKLGKDELNELQNILIQCEYDNKVLSDFTSAVDKVVVNKNVEDKYMPVNTMMIYNTKTSDFYDISMADKNGNKWLSFEKFIDLLNDYKNDNLIVVQAKLPTFKEFEPWESATIKGMFAVAKDNGNKLMDFVTVNVNSIKKNGEGQYNFKSIIDKDCYSYKFKTKQNVKIHFNKLEVNEELKSKQGFYANETQAQKIETATAKLK